MLCANLVGLQTMCKPTIYVFAKVSSQYIWVSSLKGAVLGCLYVPEVCVQNGEFCSNAGSLNHSIKCNKDMYVLCEFKNILYDVKVSPNYFVHALSHVFRWQCVDRFKWSNQDVCRFIQRCTSQLVYVRVSYVLYIQPANMYFVWFSLAALLHNSSHQRSEVRSNGAVLG
jgi:hypothetical protein